MKKTLWIFLISLLSFLNTFAIEINETNFDYDFDYEMEFNDDFWLGEDFAENLENSLNQSFLNWETNFDEMMADFEQNLENNLNQMQLQINNMMTTFETTLEENLSALEDELSVLEEELPNKVYETLDWRLETLFNSLEQKLWNTEEYLDVLDTLTEKIETLQDSWKITNDILSDALEVINVNALMQKDLLVLDNIDVLSNLNIDEITSSSLESLKWMFDSLDLDF